MGEELDTDLSKEGWRRAAPNEVVWVDSLGNKALTASDLRRSTLRNHWGLAATRLTTGSHWNTMIDEDEGWGESKSSEPADDSTSAEVWGSAPSAGWGSGGQALSNWEDSLSVLLTTDGVDRPLTLPCACVGGVWLDRAGLAERHVTGSRLPCDQ